MENAKRARAIYDSLSLKEKIGQMIMLDFRKWQNEGEAGQKDHTEFSSEVGMLIKKYNLGNVILFAENFANVEQTVRLCDGFQKSVSNGIPMFIGVDQEGGRIVRFSDGCSLPGNMAIAATGDHRNAYTAGYITGAELKALGMNVDFAPDLDVNNNPANPVINLRSFSSDFEVTAEYGAEMVKGFRAAGVASAAKHFPGHGDADVDSHIGLPSSTVDFDTLWANELLPFRKASDAGIEMYMTAHMQFPNIEKTTYISKQTGKPMTLPATLSKLFLTEIVREKIGYKGIIITDSMQMQAISSHFGPAVARVMALNAGVDILLMCCTIRSLKDEDKIATLISDIETAVLDGRLPMSRIEESVMRVLEHKIALGLFEDKATLEEKIENALKVVGCEEHRALERAMAAKGVTVLKNDGTVPFEAGKKVLYVTTQMNKVNSLQFALRRLKAEEKLGDVETDYYLYDRLTEITDELKEKMASADYVVIVTDAEASMANTKWQISFPLSAYKYALEAGKKTVILSTFLPYDVALYGDANAILICYCTKGMSNEAAASLTTRKAFGVNIVGAVEVMFGGAEGGKELPVDIYPFDEKGVYDKTAPMYKNTLKK